MFEELIQFFYFFFVVGLIFFVPAIVICGIILFLGRRRVQWIWLDYIILIIPFMVWMILTFIDGTGKSLANAVGEPFWLGCLIFFAPLTRLIIGRRINQKLLAVGLLIIFSFIAFGLWMFVPGLPE